MMTATEKQRNAGSVRELTAKEVGEVGGGFGIVQGIVIGSRFGLVGAAAGFAAGAGWYLGSKLYKYL